MWLGLTYKVFINLFKSMISYNRSHQNSIGDWSEQKRRNKSNVGYFDSKEPATRTRAERRIARMLQNVSVYFRMLQNASE